MKKGILIATLTFFLFSIQILAVGQETILINRDNTQFREGPGCFYPLIGVLKKGTPVDIVQRKQGWINIRRGNFIGWISENAVSTSLESQSSLKPTPLTEVPTMISRASVSGAIKGFAQKFIRFQEGDAQFIAQYDYSIFSPHEYERFKRETYSGRNPKKIRGRYKKLRIGNNDFEISIQLEKMGLAIAGRIASQGLVKDAQKLKYLNLVGTLVSESSELYYYPFKIYILNDKRAAAYATPNGMVFITMGLMSLINDESELACVIGHEITHTIHKHGSKEIKKRKEMIIAEGAFEEMDEETPDELPEVYEQLENMATNMYEAATSKRQTEYEYEADQFGVICAYRAGYDPYGLVRVLKRIKQTTSRDFWNPESNWQYDAIYDRIEKVEEFISKKLTKHPDWNVSNSNRFDKHF